MNLILSWGENSASNFILTRVMDREDLNFSRIWACGENLRFARSTPTIFFFLHRPVLYSQFMPWGCFQAQISNSPISRESVAFSLPHYPPVCLSIILRRGKGRVLYSGEPFLTKTHRWQSPKAVLCFFCCQKSNEKDSPLFLQHPYFQGVKVKDTQQRTWFAKS